MAKGSLSRPMRKSSRPQAVIFLRFSSSALEHRTHAAMAQRGRECQIAQQREQLVRKSDAAR
jgi:hypothetical protein